MASMLCRSATQVVRRTALISAFRASSHGSPVDPQKGKVASDKASMPDSLGHSVGPERFELLAKMAGNEDPFEMNIRARAKGTAAEPTLIPSMYETRLVGCICEEDAISINWMYLHKGESKRCHCGFHFKLTGVDPKNFGLDH